MHEREGFLTLRRIALLLLLLAVLADRAGARGPALRARVLLLLRPAERAARELAQDHAPHVLAGAACAGDPADASDPACCPRSGDSARDAALLAQEFRALAFLFLALSCRRAARAPVLRPALVGSAMRRQGEAGPVTGQRRRDRRGARAPPAAGKARRITRRALPYSIARIMLRTTG